MRIVTVFCVLLFAVPAHAVRYDFDSTDNVWAATATNVLMTTGWATDAIAAYTELCGYGHTDIALKTWFSVRGYDPDMYVKHGMTGGQSRYMENARAYLDAGYGVTSYFYYWDTDINLVWVTTTYGIDDDSIQFVTPWDRMGVLYDWPYWYSEHPIYSKSLYEKDFAVIRGDFWLAGVYAVAPCTPAPSSSVPEPSTALLVLSAFALLSYFRRVRVL